MLTEWSIILGLIISTVLKEALGYSPGGLIVPGYLALFWRQPERIVATVVTALAALFVVKLLGKYIPIYGRRRFSAYIFVGLLLRYLWDEGINWVISFSILENVMFAGTGLENILGLRPLGYLLPGLIANEADKQGILPTLSVLTLSLVILRALNYLIISWGWVR